MYATKKVNYELITKAQLIQDSKVQASRNGILQEVNGNVELYFGSERFESVEEFEEKHAITLGKVYRCTECQTSYIEESDAEICCENWECQECHLDHEYQEDAEECCS